MTDAVPIWERRFRAPKMTLPRGSRRAPDRTVYESTESGVWQVHCWDVATGARRRVSDHPVGVIEGYATFDGSGVIWFQDETGAEAGQWYVQPFAGGEARPFVTGPPLGWSGGISQAPGVVAIALSDRDGFTVYTAVDGAPAKELCRSTEMIILGGHWRERSDIGGLSADGALLALEHAEHGDLIHPALRVIDARTGGIVAEQRDEGLSLGATTWSPIAGDLRLAVVHERGDWERPALWDLAGESWTDLPLEIEGDVYVADWWPDASAVLLLRTLEGRQDLWRHELATGATRRLDSRPGHIADARVRPDGSVWYLRDAGDEQQRIWDDRGIEVVRAEGELAPAGRPYQEWWFDNGEGDRVQGFYAAPEGMGPFPVLMHPHGGPTWLDEDRFSPEVQAYVDAGFAVGLVNYRGSTGRGRAWRDRLIGDIGGPDLHDLVAGFHDLVRRGVADPERAVVAGWSWGGYLTLMALGKHPDLWRAGVAGIPVGDYVMSYEDMSPMLQAYDRALLGGEPENVPELMADRNPIVHAGKVTAPVLFVIGENDTRCPLPQAMAYVDALAGRGAEHEVYRFGTGHGSFDTDEDVRQQRMILDFLKKRVPGLSDV